VVPGLEKKNKTRRMKKRDKKGLAQRVKRGGKEGSKGRNWRVTAKIWGGKRKDIIVVKGKSNRKRQEQFQSGTGRKTRRERKKGDPDLTQETEDRPRNFRDQTQP